MYTATARRVEKPEIPNVETWGVSFYRHEGVKAIYVGFLEVGFWFEDDKMIALIDNLHTHPNHRRQGVATLMLDTLLQWPRTGGLDQVLCVYKENEGAIALYKKNGFVFDCLIEDFSKETLLPMRRVGAERETVGNALNVTEVNNHEKVV